MSAFIIGQAVDDRSHNPGGKTCCAQTASSAQLVNICPFTWCYNRWPSTLNRAL